MINNLQQEKLSLLEQFHKLTTKQLGLLEQGEYDQLLELFEQKDLVIKKINDLDLKLGKEANCEEVLTKLKELQELNNLLELKLRNTKTELGVKLLEFQQGKQTENRYSRYTQTEGAFIDKKQ